ncbi:hypothetical protein [Saccharothrix luteola]|uniref:hypothetical protein n=1 Tax=Saccharothrix luteola TaxID=2893018 RepID=UPI001E38BD69|nr:hypothetical protein [Saccharothrix luteola]MCC8242691.1 hypothetical protein [Saccharothrix luteola]
MISIRRAIAAAALALPLGAVVGAPAASASTEAAWADDHFSLCVPDSAGCHRYTYGSIVWGNRTASISGIVANEYSSGFVTAYFEAYAGSTKIDSGIRTAHSGTRGFPITEPLAGLTLRRIHPRPPAGQPIEAPAAVGDWWGAAGSRVAAPLS